MNPLDALAAWRDRRTAWWHDDNEFSSRRRMDRAHAPVVSLAAWVFAFSCGAVIDLGCGNGALLTKVAALRRGVVPFGVERDPARASRARRVLRRLGGTAVEGDVHALPADLAGRRYALVLLSLSRLLHHPAGAPRLLAWARAQGDRLLVFGYGSVLERPGGLPAVAASFGLRLAETHYPSGAAALVDPD